ncbi:hypothetical protein [Mycolicibacterium sp.]|nr:hypothetical protein [Mycolicibacterium sp.]
MSGERGVANYFITCERACGGVREWVRTAGLKTFDETADAFD